MLFHHSENRKAQIQETDARMPMLLSFLLPIVVMLGVFAGKQIFPFGNQSFLRTDMYHQYAPFLAEFARTLKEGGSLTYTTQIGLGTNYVALYAYYLSSPFNWLMALIPSGWVIEYMTYLIVLKTGFCGLSMAYYLKKRFRRCDMAVPVIAICYALSGYMAAYSWNTMWLDCLWLTPLILLGLEQLVRKNQPFLYCISLGLAIASNYYIAIMLCIFMVLYFICEMVMLPRKTIREYLQKVFLFGIFSLLAGGMAAVLIFPAARCLMTTASANSTFPSTLTSYFSMLEMLARHMVNVDVEIGLEHWPNIYSGVICLLLLPAYLINPRIDAKEKIVKTILLGFMLLSFRLNVLNYIWHGMHYPNSLPCRQSFLYTFLVLVMCYEGLRHFRELTRSQLTAVIFGVTAFIFICEKTVTAPEFHYYSFLLTLLFTTLYSIFLHLVLSGKMRQVTAWILILGISIAETGLNTAVTSVTTVNRTDYWKNTDNYQALIRQAEDKAQGEFFRVEKEPSRRTKNDGAWIGYQSASIFSSTTQSAISDFYKTFGMEGNTNAYSFTGATPLMSSLLSVRFYISASELPEDPLYTYLNRVENTWLYENQYTMPLGFLIPREIPGEYSYKDLDNPAEAQNMLVERTTGGLPVLERVEYSGSYESLDFTAEKTGRYFVYIDNRSISDAQVYIDDNRKIFNNVDRGYLLDLGICEEGAEISVSDSDDKDYDIYATAYYFNNEAFIEWYKALSPNGMDITSYSNSLWRTEITGNVTAEEDSTLFLSIPYDSGWTVWLDGTEVTADAFESTFLMLYMPEGVHTVSMTYHVSGLREGFAVTLISLLILAAFLAGVWFQNRKKKPQLPKFRGGARAADHLEQLRKEGTPVPEHQVPAHPAEEPASEMEKPLDLVEEPVLEIHEPPRQAEVTAPEMQEPLDLIEEPVPEAQE